MEERVRIEDIKPGDWVQIAHGDWFGVYEDHNGDLRCARNKEAGPLIINLDFDNLITAHATEKPEPQGEEWITEEEFVKAVAKYAYDWEDFDVPTGNLNALITRKLKDEFVRKSEVAKAVNRLCERNTARVLLLNIGINPKASPPANG